MKLTPAQHRVLQALSEPDTYLHFFVTGHIYRRDVRAEQVRYDVVQGLKNAGLIEDSLDGARNEDLDWVYQISDLGRQALEGSKS